MFSLDPSLHVIAATEPDVIAVYRSADAISPPGDKTSISEAFICAVMEDDTVHVYVAVCESRNKTSIYTTENRLSKGESYDDTLREALAFTESMGFGMESVNLKYGRALREVVVRGIKVICDPLLAKNQVQQLTRKDTAGSATEYRNREKMTEEQPAKKAEVRPAPGKAESERAIIDRENKKKPEEKRAAEDAERARILAEKEAAEALAVEQAEAAGKALKEIEAERTERERLLKEKMEAEKRAAEQVESARRAREMAEAERIEREKVLAEKLAADKRAEEQAEITRRALEEAEMERAARKKLLKEKAEAEKRATEQIESERRAREMIEAERIERERVAAEKAAAKKVAAERAEQQRLQAEKIAAEKMKEIQATRVALEKAEADRADCERVLAQKAEAERLAMATAEAAGVVVGTAESDLKKVENELLAKNAAEKALANQIEAERIAWEKAESDRAESERRLAEKAVDVKLAEEKFEAARLALKNAEAERAEFERTLAEKASEENGAAGRMESIRCAWGKAETDRVEIEMIFAEKTEFARIALERAEAARILLEKATAERIERETLFQEKLKEENRARELTEAARKTIKGLAYADREKADDFLIETACEEQADAAPGVMEEKAATDIDRVSNAEVSIEKAAQRAAGMLPSIPGQDDGKSVQLAVDTETEPLLLSAIQFESPGFDSGDSKPADVHSSCFGPQLPFIGEEAIEKAAWQLLEATSFQPPDGQKGVQSAVDVNEPTSSAFSGMDSGSSFFDSEESTSAVGFTIDHSLSNIIFCKQTEVIWLHQSLNTVRLTIEGFPAQSCAGYVCAVERKAALVVFFALYLSESMKSLVYIPDKQPGNSEECEKSVQDGITFAETVGYVMDKVEPSVEDASLDDILDAIPVFRRVARTRPHECACGE